MKFKIAQIAVGIFITLSVAVQTARADTALPYSYKIQSSADGGFLLPAGDGSLFYFIKSNWALSNQTIYSQKGPGGGNRRGLSLGDVVVLASSVRGSNLQLLLLEKSIVKYSEFNPKLELIRQITLPIQIAAQTNAGILAGASGTFISVGGELFGIANDSGEPRDLGRAETISVINQNGKTYVGTLEGTENFSIFTVIFPDGKRERANFDAVESSRLLSQGRYFAAVFSPDGQRSVAKIYDVKGRKFVSSLWADCGSSSIAICESDDGLKLYALQYSGGNYSMRYIKASMAQSDNAWTETALPHEFIEPFGLWYLDGRLIALFRNGLVTFTPAGKILSLDYVPLSEYIYEAPSVFTGIDLLTLSTERGSITLAGERNPLWRVNSFVDRGGKFLLPSILLLSTILFVQLYRHEKRLLATIVEAPSSGILMAINGRGAVQEMNEGARKLLGISSAVPTMRKYTSYFALEHTQPILSLIEKALVERNSFTERLAIETPTEIREVIFTLTIIKNIFNSYRGIVLAGFDITEQIERKRLYNWAQLAHDMQTNLSTIKLNAEQISADGSSQNISRRSKIIYQANLLIQRVRDIVTVGRSDKLEMSDSVAFEICYAARGEFDESMFPGVVFEVEPAPFMVRCDRQKMQRAIRNAIENAIRALPEGKGKITLKAETDREFAYFSIIDNGVGMDDAVKAKMLTPYFTTSQGKGGFGIGTTIMQHVAELHKGKILINSVKNYGSEIIFKIPQKRERKSGQ